MSVTITGAEQVAGGGTVKDSAKLIQQAASFGTGVLPSTSLSIVQGTGAGAVSANGATINANAWYLAQRTLAATTFDLLDLYGGLTDFEGNTLNFKYVRRILVVIPAADGTLSLRIGPQAQTHAFVGPWSGGSGATVYDTILWKFDQINPFAGWALTDAASDILPIYNPGAGPVTYAIWILGEQ